MNVIGSLRKQLAGPFDSKNAAEERHEVTVIENQRFNPSTERWSFKNLTSQDPKRFSSDVGETDQFPTVPLPAGWEYSGLWEIDYTYHDELYPLAVSVPTFTMTSTNKPDVLLPSGDGSTDGAQVSDAAALDAEGNSKEWVYSCSFEDLQRGVVIDSEGLGSGSNSPVSSASASSPTPEEALSASLRAALEAEYSLTPDAVNAGSREMVRQRRYRRYIVRAKRSALGAAEPAAALLSAKGAVLKNNASKMLNTTSKFINDLGDAQKKDIAKLVNAAKNVGKGSAGTPSGGGDSNTASGSSPAPVASDATDATGEDGAAAVLAPAAPPAPIVPSTATPSPATPSPPPKVMPARVTSFTSRMFGSLSGANKETTPTPAAVAALPAPSVLTPINEAPAPAPAANTVAFSAAEPQGNKGNNPGESPQSTTPISSATKADGNDEEPPLRRKNTNVSTTSGASGASGEDADGTERTAMTDTFEMEVDMDGADFNESASEMGDQYSDTASVAGYQNDSPYGGNAPAVGGVAKPTAQRRTSYFGLFGRGAVDDAPLPPPVVPIDPIFKVTSPALAAIGRQLRNVEQQSAKAQENDAREWRHNVKPVLETEVAALEKQCTALLQQIEREASKGSAHINTLEGVLKDLNDVLDLKKRKIYFPDSAITLGTGGVYFGLNDFWLQLLSGHYTVTLTPKKDAPSEISILLSGTNPKDPNSGVTVQFRAEGFKLAGDRGKNVPKLAFDNLKLAVSLTLNMVLSFDPNTKKWLLPAKGFNLRILSFKGPYGINRSMVGAILSLVTPMIRTAIVNAIPHELGMLLHSLPSNFCLRGEFDVRGMDMSILTTEFHKSEIFGQLSGYSTQQLEMFVLLQRAMERSAVMKNLSDLIIYRRKYAAHKELWSQLLLVWAEACHIYCDHVITAKMEQLMEQCSGSINPLLMSIKFSTFLSACDDILHKRTTAKCRVHYIDGQISLNELIQFAFQVQHRLASDEIGKSSGIKKIRLQNFIESLQTQFVLARTLVSLVCQNFDFAHLTIVGDIHSGPLGQCTIKIADLLAQAPVLLNLSIMEDKNIGALSLVPYILSFKPQENGDVCLELYSFNHDVALPVAAPAATRSPSPVPPSHVPKYLAEKQAQELLAQQSLENSSMGQCYSTNYNKLLNAITVNRALGNSRRAHGHADFLNRSDTGSDGGQSSSAGVSPGKRKSYSPVPTAGTSTSAGTVSDAAAINAHLAVKHAVLQQALNNTLNDYPTGEESDTICTIVATNPHISVIVDQAVKLAAGTELFTVIVGPKVKTWKPLGKATLLEPALNPDGTPVVAAGTADSAEDTPEEGRSKSASNAPFLRNLGCPIKVQTAPGIKMLTQVEKADVNLNLPGLIRFLLAHFRDVPLLKEYLEIFVGGVFMVEHLSVVKILIEKVAKYLLLPGLDLELNINIRIVVNNEEIVVRIETPDGLVQVLESGLDLSADNLARLNGNNSSGGGDSHKKNRKVNRVPLSAVNLCAELSIKDLVDDITEVMEHVKVFLEPIAPAANNNL